MFWYCHKRGRETRLDKERILSESEAAARAAAIASDPAYEPPTNASSSSSTDPTINPTADHVRLTTTAPEGAPMHEVQAGMVEAAAVNAAESRSHGDGTREYAEGGSLARDQKIKRKEVSQGEPSASSAAHSHPLSET